jgi:SAM-dependent methyltransferase
VNFKGDFYPESRLSGFSHVDGTVAFYSQVNALLTPQSVVLDVGCGRGAYGEDKVRFRRELRILKGKCRKVIGIDLDPAGEKNPYVDEFRRIEGERWPVESETVDVCLSDNVLEHVADPDQFFSECRRVLKPGGSVCIRTPNVLSYFGLVSKLVPNRQHVSVLQVAKERVQEQDTFPTLYRCNTIPCIRRKLAEHGFEAIVYGYDAEPGYFSFSRLLYFLGVLHQRFAPNLFKVGIHAFGKKM